MKTNRPVTNREILIKEGALLVSRTDVKGIISYVNDDFVNVSGFTRDELIGANHNIVRHPDMPSVDFKDLWLTLKVLRSWQGLIKNRTQSGDYYWVEANVIPVFKNEKVHEYLSVQRVACREKVEKKERLHKLLSAEKTAKRPAGLAAMVGLIKETDIRKKMAFALAVLLVPVFYLMYRLFLAQDYPLLAGVAASAMIALTISFDVINSFTVMLNKTIGIFYHLFEKRFGDVRDLARNDLIGDFQRTLYSMEVNLDLAQAREDAAKAMQVNQALGNVHTGVIVANNDFEIIYMNDSLLEMFKKAGSDTDTPLPHFNADKLMSGKTDSFYRYSVPQCQPTLKKPYRSELHIAGHVIRFSICSL